MNISKRLAALTLVSSLTAIAVPLAAGPAEAAFPVRVSTVQYDSPGSDTGSNASLNAEWVRLHNYGSKAKVLTGWTLRDTSSHVYTFGSFKLRPGHSVRIHTGQGSNTSTDRYQGRGWYVWNNTHDKAILKNGAGTTVSVRSW